MMQATRSGLLALALAACAPVERPDAELATARAAIADAESAGAAERAPSELAAAREKLARAERHARFRHFDEAQSLAQQAEADAQLAALRARAASAERARDALDRSRRLRTQPAGAP